MPLTLMIYAFSPPLLDTGRRTIPLLHCHTDIGSLLLWKCFGGGKKRLNVANWYVKLQTVALMLFAQLVVKFQSHDSILLFSGAS